MRVCGAAAGALLALAGLAASSSPAAVNVVFLMADDLGWNDVGYHGSEIRTPHIDSIAERGIRLDRYYATPLCSPTRAALLTGRNPLRYGIDRPIETMGGLPLTERLLPEALRDAGYQTVLAGKWHLGLEHVRYHPHNRGFGSAYGHLGPAVDYWTRIWDGGLDWHRNGAVRHETGYATHLIGAQAQRAIRDRDPAKPLFLYVAFNAPHAPPQAPEASVAQYAAEIRNPLRRTYAAMVSEMDEAIGGILATLDAAGMTANTLVVWCSDNGGAARFGADNAPLRGGKGNVFEGGIRVPAVVWQPGVVEGGGTWPHMATAADWFPTILAAAGATPAPDKPLDGVNLWPALATGAAVERTQPYVVGVFRNTAVIDGPWKYAEAVPRGGGEPGRHLFRLDQDPGEQRDLAEEFPDRLAAMQAVLQSFPRAPTVALGVTEPSANRARARRGIPKKAGGAGPPGRGGGAVDGWTEITKPPWAEAAKRD